VLTAVQTKASFPLSFVLSGNVNEYTAHSIIKHLNIPPRQQPCVVATSDVLKITIAKELRRNYQPMRHLDYHTSKQISIYYSYYDF